MRLIQVKTWDDEDIALFLIKDDTLSQEKAEQLVKDNYDNEDYLAEYGIERIFVENVYIN